jgi:ribosomal-protein-alanine N-acetyltransferase
MAALDARSVAYPWSEAQYQAALAAGNQATAVVDHDVLAGFALTMSVLDEAELLNIVIDRPFQGQGLGVALLERVMQQLREQNIRKLFLEVRASNQRARTLYQRAGFLETGLRKNYYRSEDGREHAILMEVAL